MRLSHAKTPQKATPVLFERQRHLLVLLDALGGRAGNVDFQKLLFLYCQEPAAAGAYEFVPYKFGAFSFTSYADRRKLIERCLLAEEENHWQLTDEGKRVVGQAQDLLLSAFARRIRPLRGDALVAETYRRFPYYATRSEIAERVLRGDAAALRRIEAARPAAKSPGVSTIGYEGRTLESYLNELLRSGVTLLCDVRRNPISRKYGFSKTTYWNCLRSTDGDEPKALAKVRQKYFDEFLQKDLHFFLGTTQQFHFVAPNPWGIIGVFPIPHEKQLGLF